MRVIAGIAGGVPLQVPRSDLRPTMDLVKGAIFSSIGEFIVGARVLDLFAGSGSLGIEALSRGAAAVTFVERDRIAATTIEKNLAKTKLAGPAVSVQNADVFRYLDHLAAPGSFDIILADPPYAKQPGDRDFSPELLASATLRAALSPDGLFILEHLPDATLPLGDLWHCTRDKRYGATAVAFLIKAGAPTEPAPV